MEMVAVSSEQTLGARLVDGACDNGINGIKSRGCNSDCMSNVNSTVKVGVVIVAKKMVNVRRSFKYFLSLA